MREFFLKYWIYTYKQMFIVLQEHLVYLSCIQNTRKTLQSAVLGFLKYSFELYWSSFYTNTFY